jgi:4-amino-4-deoxy-L-arabinose transferase-like glycosyltransferase
MTSFYQPHVREPVFLALTRGALVALDDQDVAVSVASLVGSTLAIFAIYLLGAELFSPVVGLLAALLTAIEFDMVAWAPEGWRDDTYMTTVLLAMWALLRVRARPSFATATVAGVLCGIACLTRVTALAFVVPGLAWILIERSTLTIAERAKAVGIASGFLCLVLGPYLINCAIATGDPLFAINYHTGYYRFAEHRPSEEPMSAASYLRSKWATRPIGTADVGFQGLFVEPFVTKWNGFRYWSPELGIIARTLSLVGLAAMTFFARGRLVIVMLVGTLIPYMFTWNLGGGNAWRFTMPVYPGFLAAAALAVAGAARALPFVAAQRWQPWRPLLWASVRRATPLAIAVVLGAAWHVVAPWFVIREGIRFGDGTSIETGERDRVFMGGGWTEPHADGVTVRVTRAERAYVRLPLPEKRPYDLVLRIDPVTPRSPERVDVLFNTRLVGRLQLSSNPERVGSYKIRVTPEMQRRWSNSLVLIPSATVPAGAAGARFGWIEPAAPIGIRLWYVRVLPQ